MLPAAFLYLAWPFFRGERLRARERCLSFALGLLTVAALVHVARLCLAGGSGYLRYLRNFLPGGFISQSAGAARVTYDPNLAHPSLVNKLHEIAKLFGGPFLAFAGLAVAGRAALDGFRRAGHGAEKRLGLLLLACAALPLAHFLLIDPYNWTRRVLLALFLAVAGTLCLAGLSRDRRLRLYFFGWLAVVSVTHLGDWARLWTVQRQPEPARVDFLEASDHLREVRAARPGAAVRGSPWGTDSMFQSITREDYSFYPAEGSRAFIWITDKRSPDGRRPSSPDLRVEFENDSFEILTGVLPDSLPQRARRAPVKESATGGARP
jgi:hypothetical protein